MLLTCGSYVVDGSFSANILQWCCESGEFEKMNKELEVFVKPPSLSDLVGRVWSKMGSRDENMDVVIQGRFDCGKARPHYVLMNLATELDWKVYKEVVAGSNISCTEVVVEFTLRPTTAPVVVNEVGGDGCAYPSANEVEGHAVPLSQQWPSSPQSSPLEDAIGVEPEVHCEGDFGQTGGSESFDFAVVTNDFSDDTFEEEEANTDIDDISMSSEDEESEGDESGGEEGVEEILGDREPNTGGGDGDDRNEGFWKSFYTEAKLESMRRVHVEVPAIPTFKDISLTGKAVCDTGLLARDEPPHSEKDEIRKGMIFDIMEELKLFLQDNSVRHHRPYDVIHSDAKLRYTVRCQKS